MTSSDSRPWFTVHSPHGDWRVIVSLNPSDSLTAQEFMGHAVGQLVPASQRGFSWYLIEEGRRLAPDEKLVCDREREFTLVMEMP